MPHPLRIRAARQDDAGAIGVIYDEGVRSGVATFATGQHDAHERRRWLAARPPRAPVYCGESDETIVAWSALAPFSHRPWYEGVAEYTVYVSQAAHGQGLGGSMLEHLVAAAPALGYWKLVGMIMAQNRAGLTLAERKGFRVVGTHRAHGRIAGEWRDVSIVERHLDPTTRARDDVPS